MNELTSKDIVELTNGMHSIMVNDPVANAVMQTLYHASPMNANGAIKFIIETYSGAYTDLLMRFKACSMTCAKPVLFPKTPDTFVVRFK